MNTVQNKPNETLKITGNWNKQSQQLKEKYPQLTDADLAFEFGKETELVKRIQTRLNKKTEEVESLLRKGQFQQAKA